MEQAAKDIGLQMPPPWANLSRNEPYEKASDKIVAFVMPSSGAMNAGAAEAQPVVAASRDWSAALALIEETSEAIRLAEERAAELNEQLQRVTAQAANELRILEAQVANAHQLVLKAEERARSAETRAADAETWLARLHDAVMTSFTRKAR